MHELSNYPQYLFTEDGVPQRKQPVVHGPAAGSVNCPAYTDSKGRVYYKLRTASGIRRTAYRHKLAEAVKTEQMQEYLVPLPGFNNYSIDPTGTPYRISVSGGVRQLAPDIGARRERFVLYDCWNRRRALSRYSLLRLVNVYKNH